MRTGTSLSPRHFVLALAAAVLNGGCAPVNRATESSPEGFVSAAGASMAPVAPPAIVTELTEAHTVSFALDRIDQRTLPLDRTYRHYGSGQNITVYVFDGGVMNTHPELEGRYRRQKSST
jgi:hypothetical protein